MPNIEPALSLLSNFSPSDWATWIDHFIDGTLVGPAISRGMDPAHVALNTIYDQLQEAAKRSFSAGLAELLPSAQPAGVGALEDPANSARIYSLLQVAAHVAPPQAKALLLSRLTSESLRGVSYAGWDLHSLLMVVCSQFGVDQKLSDYIFHSVQSIRDFSYLVICFRMLTKPGPEITPFLLLEQALPELSNSDHANRMAGVLEEALYRNGGWPLLCWFQDMAPRLKSRGIEGMDRLEEMVSEIVPWPENPESADPAMLLLAAWVQARFRSFPAVDIKALLNVLHRSHHWETEKRLKLVLERLRHYGRDWEIIDGRDETNPFNRLDEIGDFVRIVTYDEKGNPSEEKLWRSDSQPELAMLKVVKATRPAGQRMHGHRRHRSKQGQSRYADRFV